jgi:hypothetical protein
VIEALTDEQINQLIGDHWREIKGLLREKKRRLQAVSDTNGVSLADRRGDGRIT